MASRARKSTSSIPSSSRVPNLSRRRQLRDDNIITEDLYMSELNDTWIEQIPGYSQINIDDVEDEPTPVEEQPEAAPDNTGNTSTSRTTTSNVWKYFDKREIEVQDNETGGTKLERHAICKICACVYKFSRNSGTGTLRRHLEHHHPMGEDSGRMRQTTLNSQTGEIFRYDHLRTRRAMATLVPSAYYPFTMGQNEYFTEFCQVALNPNYKRIPKTTVRTDVFKEFKNSKQILRAILSSLPTRICFTSDLWESRNGLYVLCITCHWIDIDWNLQKRIISFRTVEHRGDASNVSQMIIDAARYYGVSDKLLSVTFDNDSEMLAAASIIVEHFGRQFNTKIFNT